MLCRTAVFQAGGIAEQLAAVVDDAVAIAVVHQQPVFFAHPARSRTDTVAVVVKEAT